MIALMIVSIARPVHADEIYTAQATAYCITGTTATGEWTKDNHTVASKREWFGRVMVLYIDDGDHQIKPGNYIGTYVVSDTGSEPIRDGRVIDVYISDYTKAKEFGRKQVIFQLIESEG